MVCNIVKNKISSRAFLGVCFKSFLNSFSEGYLLEAVTWRYPIAKIFIKKETTAEVFHINFANFYRRAFYKIPPSVLQNTSE